MEPVLTRTMRFEVRADGIVVGEEYNGDIPRTVDVVLENTEALAAVARGGPCLAVWDSRDMPRPSPEGWGLFIERAGDLFAALAIVADGAANVLGSFPEAIGALLVPVRVFDDRAEAIDWLGRFTVSGSADSQT